ncbi:GntR family transcriptional regulator [Pseudosulfitobacter sp. DSM 107133]|uniref:GntR family transcriptional regulator n=1 Tax=Pseudosulfitobacter sp. DSM 107133 TaxID=2883100 RepID=UPI000DF15BBA|nr:GntR family transcriptional regulator [Pseudosulfitobacter sp. DSM 107133]UOA29197.1 HTH-type transcriptional repressor RspR [Pseudosulfitobacter sp. DSM 107133]
MTLLRTASGHGLRPAGTATARVLDDLRRRIVSLELPPGAPLLRGDLAAHYSASQTPIRESLQRLEQEGLVKVFPQSRTVVTKIDIPEIYEAHFLRLSVEVEVARQLAQRDSADVVARAGATLRMQEVLRDDPAQLQMFQELDEVFHQTLYDGLGQGNLYAMIQGRSGHLNRVRRLDPPDAAKITYILQGHRAILDAIAQGDAEAAATAVRDHLSRTVSRVEALREAHREFFS